MPRLLNILALAALLSAEAGSLRAATQDGMASLLPGGLVVRLDPAGLDSCIELARSGRYLQHLLLRDAHAVTAAQENLHRLGLQGMVSAEHWTGPALPYTENLINALVLPPSPPLAPDETFRVLVPGGLLLFSGAGPDWAKQLTQAGFLPPAPGPDGSSIARKPWPTNLDSWSHPRHGPDGNPVSADTAAGPPQRVRWIAAATSEVEGLVSAGGRNFYGAVLARDGFNGLRLWHRDLGKGTWNTPDFHLPALPNSLARPVASERYLFALVHGNLSALDARTGAVVRTFPDLREAREVLCEPSILVAASNSLVRAFEVETGRPLWDFPAGEPRHLAFDGGTLCFVHGLTKRGEPAQAAALDLRTGKLRWELKALPWLDKVYRIVMHDGLAALEESSLTDHDAGNALHLVSAETGELLWEKPFAPGMNHNRQARAMFSPSGLWILHGGKANTQTKETTTRSPLQVSALDPKTGEVLRTLPAGLAHCFPPVATVKYVLSGVFDVTDLETGQVTANPITKANCSREAGWIPANGLIYTTPKHCTCWPMLRGFVALAPARTGADPLAGKPVQEWDFPLVTFPAPAGMPTASPAPEDWPTYRSDRWRSGSTASPGPASLETRWSTPLHDPRSPLSGPIVADWLDNPFVKGPLSAPTVAQGLVLVARPDAHQVVALDAATGAERWRFTARGRVDTPPTIARGLALFGCHAGYVYALHASRGTLAWQFRAAPRDERIVAYGQIESPWPVPGAVLVRDDTAYFTAGRQPLADGGVFIFAVDLRTGERQWVHRLNELPQKADPSGKDPYLGFYENSGVEFDPVDILHEEGDGIAMSRWILSSGGLGVKVDKWNAFAKLDTGGGAVWVPRGSWAYGARHQARFTGEAARRPLVVFRDGRVFGQLEGCTEIFRRDFDAASLASFNGKWITGWSVAEQAKTGGKPFRTYRVAEGAKWIADPYTSATEKDRPFRPGSQLFNDIHALALAGNERLYAIHRDGRLKVLDAATGSLIEEREVPSPVWDGLAIADGSLYLSTLSGEVVCLGGKAP